MENRVTTKEVKVDEKTYKLSKLDARSACWLFSFLGAKSGTAGLMTGLGNCTRSEFDEISALLLPRIVRVDTKEGHSFDIAILAPDGSFADKSIESNAGYLMRLLTLSILFNVQPFLTESGSSSQIESSQAGNQ